VTPAKREFRRSGLGNMGLRLDEDRHTLSGPPDRIPHRASRGPEVVQRTDGKRLHARLLQSNGVALLAAAIDSWRSF